MTDPAAAIPPPLDAAEQVGHTAVRCSLCRSEPEQPAVRLSPASQAGLQNATYSQTCFLG